MAESIDVSGLWARDSVLRKEKSKQFRKEGLKVRPPSLCLRAYTGAKKVGERQVPLFQGMLTKRDRRYRNVRAFNKAIRECEDAKRLQIEEAQKRW